MTAALPSYSSGTSWRPAARRDDRRQPGPHRRRGSPTARRWSTCPPAGAGPTPSSTPTSTRSPAACSRSGVAKGDRVGIWAPNCAEWALLQYATAKIGAILVNVNPAYRSHELAYVVNQSGMRLLVSAVAHKTLGLPRDGRAGPRRVPGAERRGLHRRAAAGTTLVGRRRRRRRRAAGRADGRARLRRPDQHPVHLRARPASPRAPRCPTTTSSTTATSSASCAATPSTTGSACRCPSTTASAW